MKTFPDEHLWVAYDAACAAGDEAAVAEAANAILKHHLPFFVQYAQQNAFAQWNRETREDYLAELLLIAADKISTYSRRTQHKHGQAAFVTYVKPYLKMVRYKIEGHRMPMRVGHETIRLAADANRFITSELSAGRKRPTNEEIAEYLRMRCGKPVSADRVPRLLALPRAHSLFPDEKRDGSADVLVEAEGAIRHREPVQDDPAEIVTDRMEQQETVARVNRAIASLNLEPLDEVILRDRLMAETPRSVEDIAVSFGVTEMEVRQADAVLSVRLRRLLS